MGRAACNAWSRDLQGRGPKDRSPEADEPHGDANLNEVKLVSRIFASWNHLDGWLRQVEALRRAA